MAPDEAHFLNKSVNNQRMNKMIEVEVKVSVKNRAQIEEKLLQMGFIKGNLVKESDFYFDEEGRQLKEKDTALRVRSCENLTNHKSEYFMTFKGPKMDSISMTRKEVEMKIENVDKGKELLQSLGYNQVYPVIKLRQYFHLDRITACLDQVEQLGDFLELEIIVPQEKEKEAVLNKIISLLGELGYKPEEIIRTSYLSMLMKK